MLGLFLEMTVVLPFYEVVKPFYSPTKLAGASACRSIGDFAKPVVAAVMIWHYKFLLFLSPSQRY
jgi:hypothetical protein